MPWKKRKKERKKERDSRHLVINDDDAEDAVDKSREEDEANRGDEPIEMVLLFVGECCQRQLHAAMT